ncbi:MAG: hypothetical protein GXZ08_10265 [Tissierellia bacterium]|nr:hypothetical protein [Tissierellia bacterium]
METLLFLVGLVGIFGYISSIMGGINTINTMINTAYDLLFNTAFYIMAVAVLAGALSEILTEFGVIAATNKLLSPIVKPIFGLPGASTIGILTTYLSDNPAILTFANNQQIRRYFKKYQLPALTNIGTAFGMGLIVSAAVAGMAPEGESFLTAVLIGNVAAIVGALVSTRLMLIASAKKYGKEADCEVEGDSDYDILNYREVRTGGVGSRLMSAALDGGGAGVQLGIDIIPGILIITTLVLMLTNGTGAVGVYDGSAYQGIGLLPMLGEKINFILKPMFGFQNVEAIAVPLTALGAAGAAVGIIPEMIANGIANTHDIAVFVAMCMCFSGYLCTHVVMMESLDEKDLILPAILSHTVGGLCAGVAANLMFNFFVG